MESLIAKTNLPEEFGLTLLLLALVLLLAPWLSSADFGFLKVPEFSNPARRVLRILGPIAFILAIAIHLPLFPVSVTPNDVLLAPDSGNATVPDSPDASRTTPAETLREADLRDLIVGFAGLVPRQIETRDGLRQYWSSWTDDCTLVLRDRQFDPATRKQSRLDTYTIRFSDVLTAERNQRSGLPGVDLRFYEGRGAELVRYTTDPNAPDPIGKEVRSQLVVGFLVDESSRAVAYVKEIARRCAQT